MVSGSAEQTAEISLSLSPMTSMNHIHKSADKWVVSFLVSVFSKTLHFHIDRFRRHGNFSFSSIRIHHLLHNSITCGRLSIAAALN